MYSVIYCWIYTHQKAIATSVLFVVSFRAFWLLFPSSIVAPAQEWGGASVKILLKNFDATYSH